LTSRGLAARLLAQHGRIEFVGDWPHAKLSAAVA
jgi:hypothetical protein